MTQERLIAELKKLRQEVESLRTQTKLFQETMDVYKSIDTIRTEQVKLLMDAIKDRDSLDVLGQKKEELYKQEVNLFKAENERLKGELSAAKKSKWINKIANALLIVGVGYAAAR